MYLFTNYARKEVSKSSILVSKAWSQTGGFLFKWSNYFLDWFLYYIYKESTTLMN